MLEQIKELEEKAKILNVDPEERIKITAKTVRYAQDFLNDLPNKKAYEQSNGAGEGLYSEPFSDEPAGFDQLLSLVEREINHGGLNPASGRHLGYIPGGGLYPSALGDYLAAVSNRYAGIFFSAPGAVRMENMCIRWMCDLVGYSDDSAGNLTSGGSIANLIALVTARDSAGLHSREFDNCVIYITRQVHHCAIKAIRFAGMAEAQIRTIEMDERFRMKPGKLVEQIEKDREDGFHPFLIFASAGTTDLGAVDPLNDLADIAGSNDLWFHVDAAYGGFFLLTEQGRRKLSGIERADSVIIDPHKGLFLPYGSGTVLIKDGKKLYDSQHMEANYMQDTYKATGEYSPADLSPELSKHFRGLRMWLPLKLFGIEPFRAALKEKLLLARHFYNQIQQVEGIEVGPEPELSVLVFRYVPSKGDADSFNRQLVQYIHRDGKFFLSSTSIEDTFYIRLAVLHFRTHLNEIEKALDMIREKIRLLVNKEQ